jgi:hypothetical protein
MLLSKTVSCIIPDLPSKKEEIIPLPSIFTWILKCMADQYVASQTDPDANVTDDCEMVYNFVNLKQPHFNEPLIKV